MPDFRIIFMYVLAFNLLIIARIIPLGGLFGMFLISIPLMYYARSGKIKIYMPTYSKWFMIMSAYFILAISIWGLGFLFGVSTSLHQCVIYTYMITGFAVVLLATREDVLERYVRIYIKVAVLMSFLGFIAWYLIFSEKIGIADYVFDGRAIGMHLYSFPYRIALVLTNIDIGSSTIGNFVFFRASGWAEEPAWAATFIMPALILLFTHRELFSKRKRIVFITILILFWIVCGAVSSVFSVLVLVGIAQIVSLLRKFSFLKLVIIVGVATVVVMPLIYYASEIDLMSGFLESKLSDDAQTMQNSRASVLWVLNPQPDLYHLMSLLSLLTALLIFIASMIAIKKGGQVSAYGYIMLYLVLHGAKRGWVWFSFDTITIFFFYLLLYNFYKQRSASITNGPEYDESVPTIA